MVAPLRRVVVKRPEEAFRTSDAIQSQWESLAYLRAPNLPRAIVEHRQLVALLQAAGAEVLFLPVDDRTGLDSLYAHDPVLMTEAGAIIFQTGKHARRGEGPAAEDALRDWGVSILGRIEGDGTAEAGDMVWLDRYTLLVGRSFRTNAAGIAALQRFLEPQRVTVIPVELPYWDGPSDVLHLMSLMSLLDDDLAIVYRRIMPIALFELLRQRGLHLVDVPAREYASMGCNVLAVAPRSVIIVRGNPITRERLEAAGCTVAEIDGDEICLPGAGGPTCLTRPILRE